MGFWDAVIWLMGLSLVAEVATNLIQRDKKEEKKEPWFTFKITRGELTDGTEAPVLSQHLQSVVLNLKTRPQDWVQPQDTSRTLRNDNIDTVFQLRDSRIWWLLRPMDRSLSKSEANALQEAWEEGMALRNVEHLDDAARAEFDQKLAEHIALKGRE